MEKYDFIKFMLRSRNLSVNDKKRLILLATREIEKVEEESSGPEEVKKPLPLKDISKSEIVYSPKDTTMFLSLFNDPNGFKFLTHDFDPDSDMDYDKLLVQVRFKFKESVSKYRIPKSLYALMYTMIYGGKKDGKERKWKDCDGNEHVENYASPTWADWAHQNPGVHLLSNEKFSDIILKFRSSIRLVKPVLLDIIKRQEAKHPNLIIQSVGLEKADFYTYVWNLENGIKRILDDMVRYADKTPNVKITFERKYSDDFSSRIIRIIQVDSMSSSLDDVLKRFHGPDDAGAFHEIKKVFAGYCNWSVEAMWDGMPKRWNILTDSDVPEVEEICNPNILGFTHILTYFTK
ncbi:hypothetical protein BARVI_12115 [Barnesiella viscericola DSM 18177]|uniref:Histidine Kinase domain-containing protein n=1 Tax=Barnesiella viscericola DSM 18177 TaxID=880074 RepID=W0EY10_9BACT|nr:hypothetical protein [Barnesiella viscericola]AHF13986.1 hypothetical protein BARVI_12115 [Barnesiella viscericola DSM 18177]